MKHHPPVIFNTHRLNMHRARALHMRKQGADFLWREMAERLLDKLEDVKRGFPDALNLGAHHGGLKTLLQNRFGIKHITDVETTRELYDALNEPRAWMEGEILPITPEAFNLVVSLGFLQWVNNLPMMLRQMRFALKPEGLLIAMFPGGGTLKELRFCLQQAMEETTGGISPRISPMVSVQDAASLFQQAGFIMPVIEHESITIQYQHPIHLLHDLRAMGQTNALHQPARTMTKKTLQRAMEIYCEEFPHAEGGITATFDIISLTGWSS